MEGGLRKLEVPVIVRVDKDEILIDLRTVAEDEFGFLTYKITSYSSLYKKEGL
jgi:seryl-tRNA(Sec) selenium transferase